MDETTQIRDRIPIVDFIAESIPLKRAGRNFKGLCPFHGEKSPSFVVSPERNIWHCFGCGKGGDIFTFLMELDRLEFPEALKILANRAGVKLTNRPYSGEQQEIKEQLLEIHHLAAEFYQYLLVKHPIGERARVYLKERGVTDALIQTFSLGFAPNAWDNLAKFLRKKNYKEELLEKSGLILRGKSGWYDRFRARIMFPLRNHRGETIAFSGRILQKDAQEAKYINSPETPLYIKGNTLYGLDVTKEAVRKSGTIVLVEGEFDVISSFHAGVTNVAAIKGSALTEAQIKLVKRFTDRIILSLDQDSAGDAASRRGIELADKEGCDIKVVPIPDGKDPDEAARTNPSLWKKAVENAVPFYDFLISSASKRFEKEGIYGKKKMGEELLPVIAKIGNTIVQAHYQKLLATKLGISEEKIQEALRKYSQPRQRAAAPTESKVSVAAHDDMVEEHLLAMILQSPTPKETLMEVSDTIDPADFSQPVIKTIMMALVDFALETPEFSLENFAKTLSSEVLPMFDKAYLVDLSQMSEPELFKKELKKTIYVAKRALLRRKIKVLSTHIASYQSEADTAALTQLNQDLAHAVAQLKRFS